MQTENVRRLIHKLLPTVLATIDPKAVQNNPLEYIAALNMLLETFIITGHDTASGTQHEQITEFEIGQALALGKKLAHINRDNFRAEQAANKATKDAIDSVLPSWKSSSTPKGEA